MTMSALRVHNDVVAEHMRDPEYRAEHEQTAVARAVAIEVT